MKMVCKKPNRYGGQKRAFGDEVEVHRTDVRLVSALGWFVPFEAAKVEPAKKVAPKAQTHAIVAPSSARNPEFADFLKPIPEATVKADATDQEAPSVAADSKPTRAYQRRDLTAES